MTTTKTPAAPASKKAAAPVAKAAPKATLSKAAPKAPAKRKAAAKTPAVAAKPKATPKPKTVAAPKSEVPAAPKSEVPAAPKSEVPAVPKSEVPAVPAGQSPEDFLSQVNDQVEAIGASAVKAIEESQTAALQGVKAFDDAIYDYTQTTFANAMELFKAMAQAKNFGEAAEIQQAYVTGRVEIVSNHYKTLADISYGTSRQAAEPWRQILTDSATGFGK